MPCMDRQLVGLDKAFFIDMTGYAKFDPIQTTIMSGPAFIHVNKQEVFYHLEKWKSRLNPL